MSTGELEARYQVLGELGRGSFGAVHHGRRRQDGGAVAIKFSFASDAEQRARILREAALLSRIRHPRLAALEGAFAAEDGRVALVYEYVAGDPMDLRLQGVPTPAQLVAWVEDVAAALDALHAHGLMHRDVKPGNVMVEPDGRARLLDFGLVRPDASGHTLTGTGILLGTPGYMAPEVFLEGRIDRGGDVYALAVLAYQLLEGALPFAGEGPLEVLQAQRQPPPPLGRPPEELRRRLDRILRGALSTDPGERPASAGALAASLRQALAAAPVAATMVQPAPAAPFVGHARARLGIAPHTTARTRRSRTLGRLGPVAGVLLLGTALGVFLETPGPDAPPAVDPRELLRRELEARAEALWTLLTGLPPSPAYQDLRVCLRDDVPEVMVTPEFRRRWREVLATWSEWSRQVEGPGVAPTDPAHVALLVEVGALLRDSLEMTGTLADRLSNPLLGVSVDQARVSAELGREVQATRDFLGDDVDAALDEVRAPVGRWPGRALMLLDMAASRNPEPVAALVPPLVEALAAAPPTPARAALVDALVRTAITHADHLPGPTLEAAARLGGEALAPEQAGAVPGLSSSLRGPVGLVLLALRAWSPGDRAPPPALASALGRGVAALEDRLRRAVDLEDLGALWQYQEAMAAALGLHGPRLEGRPLAERLLFGEVERVAPRLDALIEAPPPLPSTPRGRVWEQFEGRVRTELRDALRLRVSLDGQVRRHVPMDEAAREFFPRDAAEWWRVRPRLLQVRRFFAWMAAGGRPEALPPRIRDGLVQADREYGDLGRVRPFYPFLELDPAPAAHPLPDILDLASTGDTRLDAVELQAALPAEAAGWAGLAYARLGEALERSRHLQGLLAAVQAGGAPAEIPPEVAPLVRLAVHRGSLQKGRDPTLVAAETTWEAKPLREPWELLVAPGRDALHQGLAALARAQDEHPAHAMALGAVGWMVALRCRHLFASSLSVRVAEELLGAPPGEDAPRLVLAAGAQVCQRWAGGLLREMDDVGRRTRDLLDRALDSSMEGPLGPLIWRRVLVVLAGEGRVVGDVLRAHHRHRVKLLALPRRHRDRGLAGLVRALMLHAPRGSAVTRPWIEALQQDVDRAAREGRPRPGMVQAQGDLEAWVKGLDP